MGQQETYPGPASAELRERWRRDRRTIVRLHHPDRGGDPAVLQQELRDNDQFYRRWEQDANPAVGRPGRRRFSHAVRAVRARIPRGWPGRRRYFDL
ncbi:hypothetical protein [Aeromicrobium alkaliterrae]